MLDKAEPAADHILLELGFGVWRDGAWLRGLAEITPFMHVPGTACLRTSVLAIWADMRDGLARVTPAGRTASR